MLTHHNRLDILGIAPVRIEDIYSRTQDIIDQLKVFIEEFNMAAHYEDGPSFYY